MDFEEGDYWIYATLEEYSNGTGNGTGNDTYWRYVSSDSAHLHVGGVLFEMWAYHYSNQLEVSMHLDYADFDTNYTVSWNITNESRNQLTLLSN